MSDPTNSEFSNRAVSVYGSGDALDDFPVLKAFQQYIDAEQAKARKRLLAMGVFFGALMLVVIAIFVALLVSVSSRNQRLNDRLIEFAMKERPSGSPVVVQPPQDSAAVLALTTKLEDLQNRLADAQGKADRAVAEAEAKARQVAAEAAKPKPPSAEELEIRSLKAQLAAEREKFRREAEKAAEEKARRREEELEAYRRKHYPELYAPKRPAAKAKAAQTDSIDRMLDDLDRLDAEEAAADDEDLDVQDDALRPIRYFDNDGESPRRARASRKPVGKSASSQPANKSASKPSASKQPTATDTVRRLTKAPEVSPSDSDAHAVSVKDGETAVSWGIPD